jgi:XTP/dITP diphosphohydrolase
MIEQNEFNHELVLASSNAGKLRELSEMLQPLGYLVRTQSDWVTEDAVEDGLSFIENALIKARHAASHSKLPSLGDDSGLVVDALHGQPGIYSSRYAGVNAGDAANNQKLLQAMQDISANDRGAHFYCAMVWVRHPLDPAPLIAVGKWSGRILEQPQGTGGFGYDPLFEVPAYNCSSAQLLPADKNRLSHRGKALTALVDQIKDNFGF